MTDRDPRSIKQGQDGQSASSNLHAAAASLQQLSGNGGGAAAAAAAAVGKKKRFPAASASARRTGHITPGGSVRDGPEGPQFSSSRDASEEDNDEASGFSDSASSLRQHNSTSVNVTLPTTASDRALIDSKEAHRRPSATDLEHAAALGGGPGVHEADTSDVVMASRTSAAGDVWQSVDGTALASGLSRAANAAKSDRAALASQMASGGTAAYTPAETPQPAETPVPNQSAAHGRRKGSSPILSHASLIAENSKRSIRPDSDAEEAMDSTAANPYDGDVEFAARTPVSHQISSGAGANVSTGASSVAQSSVAASPALPPAMGAPFTGGSAPLTATYTAPSDTISRRFISSKEAANLTRADADASQYQEKPVPMASPGDIRTFIHKAIYEPDPARPYKINIPPDGGKNPARPVRIYADGVYDLFHYAHALQLRQAKLMFPCVHLLVGVVSSKLCAAHKNEPVMTSTERYTAVRNCKWVDEVVEDAPWVITQELIDKLDVDYVAHDELPYAGAGSSAQMADVYQFVKDQGRFLPTQRTEGVSTSELLARIVGQYRNHNYDSKLEKIGHKELAFE